jgi:hypothetical protein
MQRRFHGNEVGLYRRNTAGKKDEGDIYILKKAGGELTIYSGSG